MTADANFVNRTLWTSDNLDVLRGLNSESVDLIYLDPPFNKDKTYEAPIGSQAAGAAFKDAWTLQDTDLAWHGEVAEESPALYEVIKAARLAADGSMMAYLIMMAVRLIQLRRVLKPSGSIYLHCDPTAGHYLNCSWTSSSVASTFESTLCGGVMSLGPKAANIRQEAGGPTPTTCCSTRKAHQLYSNRGRPH